jgi:hypothetical protein
MELFINLPVAGINAAVTDHFEMLFRDMADKTLYELHNRKGFFHIGVIFVAVVMEGNKVAIIVVNPGRGNNGAPQIAPDIFYGSVGVTFIRFCIDIETVFVFTVTAGFYLFKRRADSGFHFTQQGSAESSAEVGIVEVIDIAPETVIAVAAFRNQAVDMRVPFQISAKGVKDHDETGSEVHGLILLKKHTGNNTVHGMEEAVKEGTVTQKKLPELLINREDAMAVDDIYELKGHRSSALHGVEITTGRAEAAVTAERDKFQLAAVGTAVHGAAERGITTVDHFIYVVNNRLTWM